MHHEGVMALIGLGSNRRHGRHGAPKAIVRAAVATLAAAGLPTLALSRLHSTPPMGPGSRHYANAALRTCWSGTAADLLQLLKQTERAFGRRTGQRWGDRVLDLDLLALGPHRQKAAGLTVPHPGMAHRRFVLDPLAEVAPDWRHPVHNATVRQLRARLLRPKPRPRRVGP